MSADAELSVFSMANMNSAYVILIRRLLQVRYFPDRKP
ncbi:hypothetical protein PROPHIGD91-3_73 [Mycobacterium phage prophi91-3]|nr:hypothetical protein PROPHIGD91-3_73 [Mycobacterium phage prophi91-3]